MRLTSFGTKILAVFAAVFLLAACETTPENKGATGGTGGAAQATQPGGPTKGSKEDFVINVGDRVFFDFDKYNIRSDARTTLEKQAAWLKQYPQYTITVEGHCDERGTREYNLALGERRANSVKNALVSLGIPTARIKTISYGKERPVAAGHNEAAWAQNRRGVTVLN
ncbi:MAG TPA: peptidoglycan-associated lipoprotein Pal [Candidatus Cybelea sp.]|nr:peptidoglycan-associated lipoprotein Pal [Candidatus Cybelea sp.]